MQSVFLREWGDAGSGLLAVEVELEPTVSVPISGADRQFDAPSAEMESSRSLNAKSVPP